ncbi:bifunctional biotin--[acetyl-CoA-carboxylase] ligase/biotin operon repressor BirA [Streptococcus dentapri]|uniref:Bifunctional ligase/repressor BirA n=1 Tax=Streptococcus dentapri TaxID=573564 RepID=A0ABV8D1Q8_9STRE
MKTYQNIYLLLSENSDFISGEALAQKLNVSRTAIWKGIKTLKSKGLVIESFKNRGYRLEAGDLLLPKVLKEKLGFEIYFNEESISTQVDAKEGIQKGQPAPALYLAPKQKQAQGRFGRPFFTPETGGIYMSLHLKPEVKYDQMPAYTLMVTASLVKAISRLTGIETQIKWVNDIYLGSKKLAGILTEAITSMESGLVTDVIIGIGLNFYVPKFPSQLKNKAVSLFTAPPTITRNDLIAETWKIFFETAQKDLIKIYKEKSLVLNRQVTFMENQIKYTGLASNITDSGQLIVELGDGQPKILNSGEISLSSWET